MLLRLSQHNPVRGWAQRFTAENTERQAVPFKAPRAAKTVQSAAVARGIAQNIVDSGEYLAVIPALLFIPLEMQPAPQRKHPRHRS